MYLSRPSLIVICFVCHTYMSPIVCLSVFAVLCTGLFKQQDCLSRVLIDGILIGEHLKLLE